MQGEGLKGLGSAGLDSLEGSGLSVEILEAYHS